MQDNLHLTVILSAALLAVACGGSEEQVEGPSTLGQHATEEGAGSEPEVVSEPGEGDEKDAELGEGEVAEPAYIHGKFTWFEHWSPDEERAGRAERFYEGLFGWTIEEQEMQGATFRAILREGEPIGLLASPEKYKGRATWMGYASVPDVDAVVGAAAEHGGELVGEPMELDGIGRFAHMTDPTGAFVGVVTAERGDPPDPEKPEPGTFAWMELWAHGPKMKKKALSFYTGAVGYERMMFEEGPEPYPMLAREGRPFAGIARAPEKRLAGRWVPYVVVEDVDATVKKARKVKGVRAKVVGEPTNIPKVGRIAVLVDPTGAVFGLITPVAPAE